MNNSKQIDVERINLIFELVKFFHEHGVKYLLAGGTACKLHESGAIYKPDEIHDLDFYVWSEHFANLRDSLEKLKSSGWLIKSVESYKIQLEKNITVEIIFLYKENDQTCFSTSDPVNGRSCYSEELFNEDVCKINGEEISIVSKDYCSKHYA